MAMWIVVNNSYLLLRIQEVNQHLNCLMASDMSFPLSMNLVMAQLINTVHFYLSCKWMNLRTQNEDEYEHLYSSMCT